MDPSLEIVLPTGIVTNTSSVYSEVAGHRTLSVEQIWKYWHVYTTTNKKLRDPTARRLENFWWHVLGSDRAKLSGQSLAKLYENISVGSTFVPLKGPQNPWDDGDIPDLVRQEQSVHETDTSSQRSESTVASTTPRAEASSSASKPRPKQPILKTSKGSPNSGHRPTARFASPPTNTVHQSSREGAATATHGRVSEKVVMSQAKKKHTTTKKFVAGGARRRPVQPRRQNSHQSSTASESGSLITRTTVPPAPQSVPTIPEQPLINKSQSATASASQVAASPAVEDEAAGSEASLTQRSVPETGKFTASPEAGTESGRSSPKARVDSQTPLAPRLKTTSGMRKVQSSVHVAQRSEDANRIHPANGTIVGSVRAASVSMGRSQSHNPGYHRLSGPAGLYKLPMRGGLFTEPTSSTTSFAARGSIIDQAGSLPSSCILDAPAHHFDEGALSGSRSSTTSLLDSRFTPTQPSSSADVPLGRTKSQLTLLLERDKSRNGDKSSPRL